MIYKVSCQVPCAIMQYVGIISAHLTAVKGVVDRLVYRTLFDGNY